MFERCDTDHESATLPSEEEGIFMSMYAAQVEGHSWLVSFASSKQDSRKFSQIHPVRGSTSTSGQASLSSGVKLMEAESLCFFPLQPQCQVTTRSRPGS